jgi:hypothetical protein
MDDFFITETFDTTPAPVAPAPVKAAAPKVEQLGLFEATAGRTTSGRKVTRVIYAEPELF